MLPLKIAARFLRTSPVQSGLIVAGIAVGIAVQIFVSSLITSLQANLVQAAIGTAPQIRITAVEEGDPVPYTDGVRSLVEGDERVEPGAVVPVRTTAALFTDGDNTAPLNLTGGTLEDLDAIYDISDRLTAGEPALGADEIIVGVDFAEKYDVGPGDEIELSLPSNRTSTLTITGVLDFGQGTANERFAFVESDLVRGILGYSQSEYSEVQVQLVEPFDSAEVAADWQKRLDPGLEAVEWQDENAELLEGLQAQSSSSIMIQVFVLVAVALGVAATLAISAVQKTRQIGILKALGMRNRQTGLVFLWEGAILGALGTLLGIVFGIGLISLFYVIPVPFTIEILPDKFAISGVVGMAVALASAVLPYRKTAALNPIEVINSG